MWKLIILFSLLLSTFGFHTETFLKSVNTKERVKESKLKDGSRTGVGAQMNFMYSYTLHINLAQCL